MRYAEVAVDVPTGVGQTFSYAIPDTLRIRAGQLVAVPFGRRKMQGLVMRLADTPQVERTRDIDAAVFDEPLLDAAQLELAEWIGERYICSLFEAAAPMLPPGGRVRPKTYLALADDSFDPETLTPLQQRVAEYIAKRGVARQERLTRAVGGNIGASISALVNKGIVRREYTLDAPSVRHKYRAMVSVSTDATDAVDEWLQSVEKRAPKQYALLEHMRCVDAMDAAHARKQFGAGAVKALLDKGWLVMHTTRIERDPLDGRAFDHAEPPTLTHEQASAAADIRSALDASSTPRRAFVIQGVTGSGKTELYLDAVQHCLRIGRRAIILVPEIALTYQTIERFAARFPGQVGVLHSGLSDGERFDQWWKIRRGEYGVVIGSRSAVFAPQPELGLIVMDEEHEWTYKQNDATPRYHARSVALRISERTGAVLVLGSASPDVGTYANGLSKRHRLRRLRRRYAEHHGDSGSGGSGLPGVDVVDMRLELIEGGSHMFSRALRSSLDECVAAGEQAMLFINRRGTASLLLCAHCGYGLKCGSCDVNMTFHQESRRFICHYCGRRRRPPEMCQRCGTYRLRYFGIGTESVAHELANQYPDAGVLRWDRDMASSPKAHEALLHRFRSGEAKLLVGTQMIAKGLHFPSVTLVGVVSADVGLSIPDYRASERAFQLLYQVAGRAGRGEAKGKVIVQTFQPDHYAIQAAAAQDYQAFYAQEIAQRRQHRNPPFSRLIRLLFAHTNRALCEEEAQGLAAELRFQQQAWGDADTDVLGAMPAFPARLRGRYRWHIVLRGANPRTLLDRVTLPQGWSVDVDPVSLT